MHFLFFLQLALLISAAAANVLGENFLCKSSISKGNNKDSKRKLRIPSIFIRGGSASSVHHVESVNDFDSKLKSEKLIVVDFTATWCGPCKMIAPVFEEMSTEFSASCDFVKVDVDEIPDLTERYQVMSMPTFLFIRNGEVVERFSGASIEKLRETILSLV